MCKISELLANDLQISVTNAELNSLFGRKGSWSRGMIAEDLHPLCAPHTLHPGQPRFVNASLEESVVQFCLSRQHDRAPAMMSEIIDFLSAQGVAVDRF
jgi:hypothetical protein